MPKPEQNGTPSQILAKYELDEIDKAILKHKVKYPAMTNQEIGEILGIDRKVVSRRVSKQAWRDAFDDYFMPAKDIIEKSINGLVRRYLQICRSKDEKVAERAIRTVLISAGILKQEAAVIESFEPLIIAFENEAKELRTVIDVPKVIQENPKDETIK